MALEDIAKGQYENLLQINIDEFDRTNLIVTLDYIFRIARSPHKREGLVQVLGSVTGFGRSMILHLSGLGRYISVVMG